MIIRLKGELETELLGLGIKPGDIINAIPDPVSKVGAMHFDVYKQGYFHECVVWPENYEKVKPINTP